jgi:aquaporin Z
VSSSEEAVRARVADWFQVEVLDPMTDFQNPRQEWRRLFSEALGTFFLVLVAAGGGMMSHAFPNTISRQAAVVAPALMVMAVILFMGKVSGAHLNPAVSVAFALRGDFPWRRVPGYVVVQLGGRRSPRCSCTRSSTCRRSTARTTRPPGTRPAPRSGWSSSSRSASSA